VKKPGRGLFAWEVAAKFRGQNFAAVWGSTSATGIYSGITLTLNKVDLDIDSNATLRFDVSTNGSGTFFPTINIASGALTQTGSGQPTMDVETYGTTPSSGNRTFLTFSSTNMSGSNAWRFALGGVWTSWPSPHYTWITTGFPS
jgi:hypothetical protein